MRARRRLRVLGLRGLRTLRRHHFSLLSAAILGGALGFVVTDGSFDVARPAPAPAAAVAVVTATSPATNPAPPIPNATPVATPHRQYLVVYYIVESLEQWDAIHAQIRGEMLYLEHIGERPSVEQSFYFMYFETEEQEANGLRYLNEMLMLARHDGIPVQIIDLRQ